jgi:hypothetical protein
MAYFGGLGSDVQTPVVTFIEGTSTQPFIAQYGRFIANVGELNSFLLGEEGRKTPEYDDVENPTKLNPTLLTYAENIHQHLDDAWQTSSSTEIYQIAGWGEPTLATIEYRSVRDCLRVDTIIIQGRDVPYCGLWGSKLTFNPKEVIDGDGTVVAPSALAMSTSLERVRRYWVDLRSYGKSGFLNSNINREHKDILEIPFLRSFVIRNIITNSTSTLPAFVLGHEPFTSPDDPRLTFVLHSPLTLEFTDTLGNHVGPSTSTPDTIDQFVPEARYTRYGEVQVLSIPKTASGTLVLNGVSPGSFTLDIEEVNGNVTLSQTSFEGIPSSTSTLVTMDINPTQSLTDRSSLIVDYDGDGVTDFTLQSKQDAIVTLPPPDLTPPSTIASTIGTIGANSWYTSDVIITLSATDMESGVASTTYSLDNGQTWVDYTNPFTVSTEGSTTIRFSSSDAAGNREVMNTITILIDKTAPESLISVSTSTQDLLITGSDNLGPVDVSKDSATTAILTDQAGHITKLFFAKTFSGKRLTAAKLIGIQYDTNPRIVLQSSSFVYLWDPKSPTTLLSQTIAVNNTHLIQAVYDKSKNRTTIVVLKKSAPIKTQTYTGLRITQLTTTNGVIGYSL